jgi:2-polyprenyl-3-methyl-5-hydroxy-6-metoxy-1,4-benzoquinol methylase
MPSNDGVMYKSLDEAKNAVSGNIVLQFCRDCGFVFNSEFREEKVCYDENYNNNQNVSERFEKYTDELIIKLKQQFKLENKRILEIACGQGDFLKKISNTVKNVTCVGYDPSYKENSTIESCSNISIKKEYFQFETQGIKQDVIIMRHVLEHLPVPNAICTGITKNLLDRGGVMLEVPDFTWILQQESYFDILYQHCNYFTEESLSYLLKAYGFSNINCEHVFGEQYLVGFAKLSDRAERIYTNSKIELTKLYDMVTNFANKFTLYKSYWEKVLSNQDKRFAIWGALGKGVNFVHITDKTNKHIHCAIDINKEMQGGYLPGTRVPIISPQSIKDLNISDIIIMNPNYKKEIIEMANEMGMTITFHDSSIK